MKVHSRLPEITPPKADPPPDLTMEDCNDPSEKHRGRRREREAMCENLNKLISCTSPREYWDLIRSWTDSRAGPCGVTPSQLHLSFKKRSNPPDELPDYFDPRLHAIIAQLYRTIPRRTRDRTSNDIFSRPVTEKDIGRMKKKLRSRAHRSACGIDDVSYAKILTIPNDALVFLIETCVRDCDAPQRWLVTILAGFLKQGKPADDPDGYRLVAKECCLLKLCTMVFEERLREWGDTVDAIPDSQNGFRPGRRTSDNIFILICAIARARAEGKTLFVFYGDLTNAFPFTDMERLWVDLYAAGVSGPWFDWMRMIYARMVYVTQNAHGEEAFKALLGLLTGDTASPGLWNFFFRDFRRRIWGFDISNDFQRE